MHPRTMLMMTVSLTMSSVFVLAAPPPLPTPGTQALIDEVPGLIGIVGDQKVVGFYGPPIAETAEDPLDDNSTRNFVDAFLSAHPDALGVDAVQLRFESEHTIRNGKFTVFTYSQRTSIDDPPLPVHGTIVKIVVLNGPMEKIAYIGMNVLPVPEASLNRVGEITAQQAIDVAGAVFGYLTYADAAEAVKVVCQADDDSYHRAWRFAGWDDDESWRFFVDTTTSEIVQMADQIIPFGVSGTVQGYATPGTVADNPNDPSSQPTPHTLEGVVVRAKDGGGQILDETFATTEGVFDLTGLSGQVTVETVLEGEWFTVESYDSADNLVVTAGPFSSEQTEIVLEYNNPDFPNPPASRQSEFPTAQVNAFRGIQAARDWFLAAQPGTTVIDQPLTATVNKVLGANPPALRACVSSGYNRETGSITMFASATECSCPPCPTDDLMNAAFSTLMSHEYGHFISDQLIPIVPSILFSNRFFEGVADVIAAFTWDTSCFAEDRFADGLCWRDLEDISSFLPSHQSCGGPSELPCKVQYNDPRCPGSSSHCYGLALAGAFWDLRATMGQQATDELFADFLFISDGGWDKSVRVEVLIADDVDANIGNGTPHQNEILQAFNEHNWVSAPFLPPAGGTITVEWVGPIGVDPMPGEDYVLKTNFFPPIVILQSTEGGDPSIPVSRYKVGCADANGPCALGLVHAKWDGTAHDIVVEVGSDIDPDLKCSSVNVVEIPTQSSDLNSPNESTWSSVVLQLTEDLLGHVQAYANADHCEGGTNNALSCVDATDCPGGTCVAGGQGGRVSGAVAGLARRVFGEGIGVEASGAATLAIGGSLQRAAIATIPTGSVVSAGSFDRGFTIRGPHDGSIQSMGTLVGPLTIESDSSGDILIEGNIGKGAGAGIPTAIQIMGNMSGDIIADANNNGNGTIRGRVIVTGEFTGDICGAPDLSVNQPLPARIEITFGAGASICGVPVAPSPVTTPPSPDDIPTNRYLAFEGIAGEEVAIQIELIENTLFPGSVGVLGWVFFPDPFPPVPSPEFRISRIATDPFYLSWELPGIQMIHVSDCEIAPGATYALRAIRKFMDTSNPELFSEDYVESTIDLPLPNEWGDIVGFFDGLQWTPPQGTTNFMDVQAAIQAFQHHPNAPAPVRADVVLSELLSATVCVDMTDIHSIVLAFQGRPYPFPDPVCCADPDPLCCTDPSTCGGGGPMAPMGPGGSSLFSLVATSDLINANDTVDVDVFIDMATDLGAFQATLEVTGGDTGSLTVDDLVIEGARQDYVFNTLSSYDLVDLIGGRLGSATADGSAVNVSQTSYLGTFTFLASADASGVFNVNVKGEPDSFLNDSNVLPITISLGTGVVIGVDVECVIDSQCDDGNTCTDDACNNGTCAYTNDDTNTCGDGNDCTDDACTSGTCVSTNDDTNTCTDGNDCTVDSCLSGVCTSTNEPFNTVCDDGLFCTKTDKCDGAGVCVGTGDPCNGRNPFCCEPLSTCGWLPCS